MMPILSDYQEGTRNAKVYRDNSGKFCVIVFDAEDDYNGFESFYNVDDAENFAEDWVLRAGR
jgi:hypothetical protein